jgi:hypothetical protein
MKIRLTVEVEVEHRTGKFVAKDEIAEEIGEWIENADEGDVWIDESEYEVVAWEVTS